MFGTTDELTRGEQREAELHERDEKIAVLMGRQYAVEVIAEIVGIEPEYCRKATRRIAAARNLRYKPGKEAGADELLSEDSRLFRSNLASLVHQLREEPGQHPIRLSREIGLTQSQQVKAKDRPFAHDYKLSQLERIARKKGRSLAELLVWAALNDPGDPKNKERMQRVLSCLSS